MSSKQHAADAAVEHIQSGMVVGLGTGSTAELFINSLGAAVKSGKLKDIRGIATSVASESQARRLGIEMTSFAEVPSVDVTVDGADEIGPGLLLIKGLGGALLREKLVAQNSRRMIVIADEGKVVPQLGSKCPLPVEVVRFSHEVQPAFLRSLGCTPTLRAGADGKPYVTDNGNYIYDCRFAHIADANALDRSLKSRAGVVETGLFIGIATLAIVGGETGVRTISR